MSEAYLDGVHAFLDDLASGSPTPGGGAAAAVVGSIGIALTSMVANLTIGKKKYAAVEQEAIAIHERAAAIRARLMTAYQEDIHAFEKVMDAFGLPKSTDDEKAHRQNAIQDATKEATISPMQCGQTALEGLDLALAVAKIGNTNAISDAGAGSLALVAAVFAATLNMRINLAGLKDQAFVQEHAAIIESMESKASSLGTEIRKIVLAKI